jgi:hypothetical protein
MSYEVSFKVSHAASAFGMRSPLSFPQKGFWKKTIYENGKPVTSCTAVQEDGATREIMKR